MTTRAGMGTATCGGESIFGGVRRAAELCAVILDTTAVEGVGATVLVRACLILSRVLLIRCKSANEILPEPLSSESNRSLMAAPITA